MTAIDLVIRSGSVVDGTGGQARTADVAISGGVVVEVGQVSGTGHREISADGALVTPGWVDLHTHYDGQVTWDNFLAPSSWHGVTTVVMGNCGVGFAPVHDGDRERLIELMEGVEDIPGTALHDGLKWDWNDFGEYLEAADRLPHDIDFGVYVPHDPLRVYVMGDRGARRQEATEDEIAEMGRLAFEGVQRGALGFSTDRLGLHRTSRGEHPPAYGAAARECIAIAEAVGRGGKGILQLVSDFDDVDAEFAMLRGMVERSGLPLSFTLTYRYEDREQRRLRSLLAGIESANADGLRILGQVAPRSIGFLYGLDCMMNPFSANAVYQEIADLPLAEKVAIMKRAEFRDRLLANVTDKPDFRTGGNRLTKWDLMYELSDPPDYEPNPADSVAARAARAGRDPAEVAYDLLLADGGSGMIYVPSVNYPDGNLDVVKEMLEHRYTLPGLSDGGAHVESICDASFPTTLLAYWGRDRPRGRLDVPYIVKQQCADTAAFAGLRDRGVLAPGYRADVNVIDFEGLGLRRPHFQQDLPAGGKRLMQAATGYLHTIVAGVGTYEDGVATGALPGRLVRGDRPAPMVDAASGRRAARRSR
jgi:N-acyl-D-aspartate/D-glutamate deacylase